MNPEMYDIVVIGGGPGGYHAAIRASQYNAKVALIEKDKIGGTCLNKGCIPTKALYSSAKLKEDIDKKAKNFGIILNGDLKLDFAQIINRKNKIVNDLISGIEKLLKYRKIAFYHGVGSLIAGNKEKGFNVKIEGEKTTEIKGKQIIIATGSEPALFPGFNIDHQRILTSDDILAPNFKTVPETLLIVGGGVIGCEFAYIFNQMGSKIILIEYLDTILAFEEKLVVNELKKKFRKMNIDIYEKLNCLRIENLGDKVRVTVCPSRVSEKKSKSLEENLEADFCLISIGRTHVSYNLGLDKFNIKTNRNQILVNPKTLETGEPGIYAIGDVTGGLMFAYVASYEGDVAVYNALTSIGGFDVVPIEPTYDFIPITTFTNPPISSVGLREKIAREKGYKISVGRFTYAALAKAKCEGDDDGFLMVIGDLETDRILGASCIGLEAPELIAEIVLAMKNDLRIQDVIDTVHSHPTISEMVLEACEDVHGLAIHKIRRRR